MDLKKQVIAKVLEIVDLAVVSDVEFLTSEISKLFDNEPRKICWWSAVDVEHVVTEHNEDEDNADDQIEFTDELGDAVLDIVEDRFDANYGVDWDSLRDALSDAR